MAGLIIPPMVKSSDGQPLILPGRKALAGNAGKVLSVNSDGSAYELATPSGGGGGGGIMAMNEVYASSFVFLAGQSYMEGITYGSVYDPANPPGGGSIFVDTVTSNDVLLVNPGWYSITAVVGLFWDSEGQAPPDLMFYIQGGDSAAYNNEASYKTVSAVGGWGVAAVMAHGPAYINSGRDIHFECRTRGGQTNPNTSNSNSYLAFCITRHD